MSHITLHATVCTRAEACSWVYGPSVKDPGSHQVYDYTKAYGGPPDQYTASPGATPVNQTFDISYGFNDSEVKGFVVVDVSI